MDTAALFNISNFTDVYNWKKQLELGGLEALESKKKGRPSMKKEPTKETKQTSVEGSVKALEARIKQLEIENEYLKS